MAVTPTVIQRLREAIRAERDDRARVSVVPQLARENRTDDTITAVERELAVKDAEIAELRKRPTLEEVEEAVDAVCAKWERHDMGKTIELLAVIRKLYAEKARAEAPQFTKAEQQ